VSNVPLGRRERKKLATRDRIVDCATALFTTRGYEATSMEDIGECADVARATVFNHFDRKEDILLAWFARRRAEAADILGEPREDGTDTAGRLRRAVRGLAELYESDPATGRAMVRAWLRAGGALLPQASDTALLFADTIRSGRERGDVRSHVDPTRAGQLLLDAYTGVVARWAADDDGPALRDELMAMLDLVLEGIAGRG
jgi:AcrR family transcriptional regulator